MANVYTTALLSLSVATPALSQCEPSRFFPDFEPRMLEFGVDVAISDAHLLIADRFGGYVYAFHRNTQGEWVFSDRLLDASGGDIVLDGDRFITGSLGVEAWGGGIIYEWDGALWSESGRISSFDDSRWRYWGQCVTLHNDRAATCNRNGAVLLFHESDPGVWEQTALMLVPPHVTGRTDYGNAMAMDSRFFFVGAPREDTRGIPNEPGAVYVYRWDDDNPPVFVQKLEPGPVDYGPNFGSSLAVEGDTLVVGAISRRWVAERSIGAAYVYRYDGEQWTLQQELLAPEPQHGAYFGWDVSLDGDLLAVGARGEVGTTGVGAAHLFRREGDGQWRHVERIISTVGGLDYAEAVDLGGGQLAIGCSEFLHMGEDQGMTEVYDLSCLLCRPDLDADDELTIFDFLLFFNAFDAGDPIADFDSDGELTIFDFLAFQTAFDAGCE